ncbi:MAG TPA: hypothetical protein VFW29_04140 [Solirubrobacteraceae bacterium]|nr:hypothetical protein [Solirubrobacteraceae bacterium]
MAILRIVSRGLDRETYDVMRARLHLDREHPLGLIMHGVSEKDGRVQVAQIWDSEEYAQRFDEELLAPIIQAVGASSSAEVTTYELEDLITP